MKFKRYFIIGQYGQKQELTYIKTDADAERYVRDVYVNCGIKRIYVQEYEYLGETELLVDTSE